MRNLNFPENTFDGLWACASFLHIPKNQAKNTLLGFKRVLKSNGLLFMSLKQGFGEKLVREKEFKENKRFFALYTEEEIKNLFESCNFKILKIIINKDKDDWVNVFAVKN